MKIVRSSLRSDTKFETLSQSLSLIGKFQKTMSSSPSASTSPTKPHKSPSPHQPPLKKQKLHKLPQTSFNTPLSQNNIIQNGDLIILGVSNTEFKPFIVEAGGSYQCKKGTFHADDMIGKPFGSKIFDEVMFKKRVTSKMKKVKDRFRKEHNDKLKALQRRYERKLAKEQEQQKDAGNHNAQEATEQKDAKESQQNTEAPPPPGFNPNTPLVKQPEMPELSRSLCEITLLPPSAPLWTRALKHRTQIIYDADIATIIFKLRLHNGSRVVEAGTGSGSLTHALIQTVMPRGHVFTFEFHEQRWEAAQKEMRDHGFEPDYVTLTHGDVTSKDGFAGVPDSSVDAVFLDLPAPWLCCKEVDRVLRVGGMVCTFSPCIEQVQRTMAILHQMRYEDVETMEVIRREYFFKRHSWNNGTSGEYLESEADIKGHTAYLSFARKGRGM